MLLSGKVTAAPFCLWSCRGRACPARGIAWADVYGVVCRGGIYPSRDACGSGNIRGASGKQAFTGSHRAGHARPLPLGFGADATCITAVGRHAPMPPKVRVAACLTGCCARPRRRGQDPSLRTNVHGCFVGSGLDRSVPVCGNRRLRTATGPGMPGPYRAALGQMLPVLQPQGGMLTPSPPQFPRPSGSCGPAAAPRRLRAEPSPSNPDPAIGRTCTRCASPSPSF